MSTLCENNTYFFMWLNFAWHIANSKWWNTNGIHIETNLVHLCTSVLFIRWFCLNSIFSHRTSASAHMLQVSFLFFLIFYLLLLLNRKYNTWESQLKNGAIRIVYSDVMFQPWKSYVTFNIDSFVFWVITVSPE